MLIFGKNSIGRQRFFKIDRYKNFQVGLYQTIFPSNLILPFGYEILPHLSVAKHLLSFINVCIVYLFLIHICRDCFAKKP